MASEETAGAGTVRGRIVSGVASDAIASERIEVYALDGISAGLFTRPVRPGAELIFDNRTPDDISFDFRAETPLADGESQVPVKAHSQEIRFVAADAGGAFPFTVASAQVTQPMLLEVEPNGIAKFGVQVEGGGPAALQVTIQIHTPRARSVEVTFQNKLAGTQPSLDVTAKLLADRSFRLQLLELGILPPIVLNGEGAGLLLRAGLEETDPGTLQNGGGQFVEIIIDP